MRLRHPLRALALLAAPLLAAVFASPAAASTPAWTTYHHDALRSGFDPDSTSPVAPSVQWQSPTFDAGVWGQPLVYGSLVYVATENDTVYALNAATGAIVWHRSAGTAVPDGRLACGGGDIAPDVGITSTPVIDPATNRIYVVASNWDGANVSHRLVSFDLTTGSPSAPRVVDPPGSTPSELLQRPALALDVHNIVIGYGGYDGDCGGYHGWLVGVNENGSGPLDLYESTAQQSGDVGGAIWGAGNGPALDASGDIYAATGNGAHGASVDSFNPPPSFDYSETVLKLSPSLGTPLDYWAPTNWQSLDAGDTDLGSSEPLPLPGGLLLQAGKDGNAYLVRASSMGHVSNPPGELDGVCPGGSFGSGVYATGTIYLACQGGLQALSLDAATATMSVESGWNAPTGAIGPPIIAGGLVWSTDWNGGTLYGLNPQTGAVVFSADLGGFNHFASPSAAGGRLFVANGDKVTALKIANYTPSGPGPVPLRLTGVGLTRKRFKAGRGSTLELTLSESAIISVVVRRRGHHRVVRRLTRSGAAGANGFKLRLRGLKPGSYVATVTAIAGNGQSTVRLRFKIRR